MKDRFLPPPLPVVYSSTGIEWAKDDKEASYLSLFQKIALNGSQWSFTKTSQYEIS